MGTRDPFTSCPDCIEVEVFTIANADKPDADPTDYHARPAVKEAGNWNHSVGSHSEGMHSVHRSRKIDKGEF